MLINTIKINGNEIKLFYEGEDDFSYYDVNNDCSSLGTRDEIIQELKEMLGIDVSTMLKKG